MRRMSMKGMVILPILLLLSIWSLWQLMSGVGREKNQPDAEAVKLLYEVSEFQMEQLSAVLLEGGAWPDTEKAAELRRAAFAASFVHHKWRSAMGEEAPGELESCKLLVDYTLRLENGGERKLKPSESAALQETGKRFTELLEAYEQWMTSDSKLIDSRGDKVKEEDDRIVQLLQKELK